MFPTEVKSQCQTRPATTASHGQHRNTIFVDSELYLGQKKYRQVKQKARALQKQYESMLSNVHSLKKSIDMTRHKTCQKRLSFFKTYEAKKLKIKQYELEQQKKMLTESAHFSKKKHTKVMKLNSQLQTMLVRSDLQKSRQKLRQKNKTDKLLLKSQFLSRKACQQIDSRTKYQKIKQSQLSLKQKKQQIAEYISLRARHNYNLRVEQEKGLINSYDTLLRDIEQFDGTLTLNGEYSTLDQGFLITTKKEGF